MSQEEVKCHVTVTDMQGHPIDGARIFLVSRNGTYRFAISDDAGFAEIVVADRKAVTVFVAHLCSPAFVLPDTDPLEQFVFRLPGGDSQGSVIAENGSVTIPGLEGRLNPIRDSAGRMYIYGDNLSFDDQPEQPFFFRLHEPFYVEDSLRRRLRLKVISIIGRCSLIEYEPDRSSCSQSG